MSHPRTVCDTIITADASKVSPAEFVRAFAPRPSRLHQLVGELWGASPERVRELHEEIKALRTEPYSELNGTTGEWI